MKHPSKNPALGGALREQLDDLLTQLPPRKPVTQRRWPRRVRSGIAQVRRYICSQAGAHESEVSDRHVAKLTLKLDWGWLYENSFYIGHATLEEMQVWATDVLAGRIKESQP